MQYFIGKVCSIVATSMNRSFEESISREHFVVRIQEINMDGIWGTYPYNEEMISFFAMQHIISIHQEVELNPANPEHAQMIAEYEKKTGKKVQGDLPQVVKPIDQEAPKSTLMPVLKELPEPEEAPNTGNATFVDITKLEKMAEFTKRTIAAYEVLGKD